MSGWGKKNNSNSAPVFVVDAGTGAIGEAAIDALRARSWFVEVTGGY